jgi:hypothetical protein
MLLFEVGRILVLPQRKLIMLLKLFGVLGRYEILVHIGQIA